MNKKIRSPVFFGVGGFVLGFLALVLLVAGLTLFGPFVPPKIIESFNNLGPTLSCILPLGLGVLAYLWGRSKQ